MKYSKLQCQPKRWIKLHYLKILRLKDTPEKIAGGFAIGVFIGLFPTPWIGLILAPFLATILKRNRVASILGTLVMNPFTSPFVYAVSYTLGVFLLGQGLQNPFLVMKQSSVIEWFGKDVIVPYLIGITIVTIIGTALSYWFILRLVIIYQKRKLEKLHHNKT
ncbi:MAG: DUF2062 domain-containing protein [bacterium]|nr:DUF2062 domain-containing protein [bacterium]